MRRNLIRIFKEADYLHCFLVIYNFEKTEFFFDHIDMENHGVNPKRFYAHLSDSTILVLK